MTETAKCWIGHDGHPMIATEVDFQMSWHDHTKFPFFEDEDGGGLYGYGHRDKDAFAKSANEAYRGRGSGAVSIPDQSIECQNPNCGCCSMVEEERAEAARAAEAALLPPEPPAPPMPPWFGKAWTEFGYQTFEQYENRLEWERTARDVCACSHMRQKHTSGGCLHFSLRAMPYRMQVPCDCTGFTEPVAAESNREAS